MEIEIGSKLRKEHGTKRPMGLVIFFDNVVKEMENFSQNFTFEFIISNNMDIIVLK